MLLLWKVSKVGVGVVVDKFMYPVHDVEVIRSPRNHAISILTIQLACMLVRCYRKGKRVVCHTVPSRMTMRPLLAISNAQRASGVFRFSDS